MASNSKIQNDVFNIGSDNTYSINYLTDLLEGKKEYIPKRPGEPDCTFADITKAKNILKWFPKISFAIGVEEMIKNINYWKNAPLWDKNSIADVTKNWFKYLS